MRRSKDTTPGVQKKIPKSSREIDDASKSTSRNLSETSSEGSAESHYPIEEIHSPVDYGSDEDDTEMAPQNAVQMPHIDQQPSTSQAVSGVSQNITQMPQPSTSQQIKTVSDILRSRRASTASQNVSVSQINTPQLAVQPAQIDEVQPEMIVAAVIVVEEQPDEREEVQPEMLIAAPAVVLWEREKVFENDQELKQFLQNEENGIWSSVKKEYLKKGLKQTYRCNKVKQIGPQCAAGIYTLSNSEPGNKQIVLFRKNVAHNHEGSQNLAYKMSNEVRGMILNQLQEKKTLKGIMYALRQNKDIVVPTQRQVQSVIDGYRKRHTKPKLTLGQLRDFVNQHSEIPEDENKAFVVNYQRHVIGERDQWFRMFVSTPRLLRYSTSADIIHADGTYKITVEKHPLLIVGTTDKTRRFHLIGIALATKERSQDYEFLFDSVKRGMSMVAEKVINPKVLMADSAAAIQNGYIQSFNKTEIAMCYAHVCFNFKKYNYKDQKNRQPMKSDLRLLHLMDDEQSFDIAWKLFKKKWEKSEPDVVSSFEKSFILKNKNWYEGFRQHTPTTNNALESFNRTIKTHQTAYNLEGIARFIHRLLEMVEDFSREYNENGKLPPINEVEVQENLIRDGFDAWKANNMIDTESSGIPMFYIPKGEQLQTYYIVFVKCIINIIILLFRWWRKHD